MGIEIDFGQPRRRQAVSLELRASPRGFSGEKGVRRPRRDDLIRTLSKGIDGTSMPAFGLLPLKEIEQLASYVVHLSIRGEVEEMCQQFPAPTEAG